MGAWLRGSLVDSIPAVLIYTLDDVGRWPRIQIDNFGGARALEMLAHSRCSRNTPMPRLRCEPPRREARCIEAAQDRGLDGARFLG